MAWHPAHDLVECETGHWELYDKPDSVNPRPPRKYADITLVKRSDGSKAYRCLVLLSPSPNPVDVGRKNTLWEAAQLVYMIRVDEARGIPVHPGYPKYHTAKDFSLPTAPEG